MRKEKYKFKLSDLIPVSWFYKLKKNRSRERRRCRGAEKSMEEKSKVPITEKNKSISNQTQTSTPPAQQSYTRNRPTYYIPSRDRAEKLLCSPPHPRDPNTLFPLDTPRISESKLKKKLMNPSTSSVCTCRLQSTSIPTSEPSSAVSLHRLGAAFDDELCEAERNPLPHIVTKRHSKTFDKSLPIRSNHISKQGKLLDCSNMGSSSPRTQGIKIHINSPKLLKKRARQRKALGGSFVVVKSPSDPVREFRESMVEMIVHHNLQAEKDLEELLTCYLTLNSDEFHDLIVMVFKQIWLNPSYINLHSARK